MELIKGQVLWFVDFEFSVAISSFLRDSVHVTVGTCLPPTSILTPQALRRVLPITHIWPHLHVHLFIRLAPLDRIQRPVWEHSGRNTLCLVSLKPRRGRAGASGEPHCHQEWLKGKTFRETREKEPERTLEVVFELFNCP